MADETKDTPENQSGEKPGATGGGTEGPVIAADADKPKDSAPAEVAGKASPEGSDKPKPAPPKAADTVKPAPPKAAATPAKPAPPKAAPAAGHKPAPPRKGPEITAPISGDAFIDLLKQRFGDAITEAVATLGQQNIRVKKETYLELCRFLHDNDAALFDMCTDLTALHWPERAGQEFDVVALLYSVPKNRRIRVKVALADGEACPSVTPIWMGADWMEREVYDMFGIRFEGHPDLRRILLPVDWPGHPLRKEYPIEYRDNEWTDKHLQYREIDFDTSVIDVKYAERR
jgi:NADH-quinone oxidoreductase subunit C